MMSWVHVQDMSCLSKAVCCSAVELPPSHSILHALGCTPVKTCWNVSEHDMLVAQSRRSSDQTKLCVSRWAWPFRCKHEQLQQQQCVAGGCGGAGGGEQQCHGDADLLPGHCCQPHHPHKVCCHPFFKTITHHYSCYPYCCSC